jgi:hypothetical protein
MVKKEMKERKKIYGKFLLGGTGIGLVNGLFGGGGGMIAVPVLERLLGFEVKQTHATAIAVIAPVCVVSAVPYLWNGCFRGEVVLPTAIGVVAGGALGALLFDKLPVWLVDALFIMVMLVAGMGMLR